MFRHILHVILAILLWIVFVYYWIVVFQRPMNPETQRALVALGILALLSAIYFSFWILHNIRIFQKMQRRRNRREGLITPLRDFLGRWIVLGDDPTELQRAGFIVVEVRSSVVRGKRIEEKVIRSANKGI